MSKPQFLLGLPVEFKQLCMVYPPKVKEVIGNAAFPIYSRILTLSQEDIEDEFNEHGIDMSKLLSPFEYILNNAFNSKPFEVLVFKAFEMFIHEPIAPIYDQKKILIGDLTGVKSTAELRFLDEDDYFDFQNLVRESLGAKTVEPPNFLEHPKIIAMKAKARYRDRVKAKSKNTPTLETMLTSLCCMNYGLNPLNIGELSYAAMPQLISRYQEKEKYDLDIKSLLAGADSKKVKPKYWIRNIED